MTTSLDGIRTYKRGTRLRADEFNALVESAKQTYQSQSSFLSPAFNIQKKHTEYVHKQTRFHTTERIPAYSIFAILPTGGETGYLDVEKYDEERADRYCDQYFGTNGKNEIPENTVFYGYIIDDQHDFPIQITNFSSSQVECGFSNKSFSATCETTGLYISGKCPFGENYYFVRKKYGTESSDSCVLCRIQSGNSTRGYEVELYENGAGNEATGKGKLFFTELAFTTNLPGDSWVIGHPVVMKRMGGNEK